MLHGLSTLGCPDLTLDAVLALAEGAGLDAVELRALEGTVDLVALFAARFGTEAALAARLGRSPVRVVAFGTSFRMITGTEADRAALLAYGPWAEAAGVPWLRIFDGGESGDAAELDRAAAMLAWWEAERRRRGWSVGVMIETHDALAAPDALARFAARCPEARLLWDCHHTWRKGGADPVATWAAIGAQTVHIHVKDSVSRPGPRLPYSYVLPGEGEFPMAPLMARLRADAYGGVLSLEWERLWHPDLPPIEAALAAAQRGWW